jgi:hypothetical protein
MGSSGRFVVLLSTHLAAFAGGWLVWTNMPARRHVDETVAGDNPRRGSSMQERRRLRDEAGPGGEQVLKRLFGAGEFTLYAENEDWSKSRRGHYEKLFARAGELPPAEDRAGAATLAIEAFAKTIAADDKTGDSSEMTSRLVHWMQSDPDAAIAYLGTITDSRLRKHVTYFLGQAAMAITTRTGLVEATKWFKTNDGDGGFNNQLKSQLVRELGANADLNEIAAVRQRWEGSGDLAIDAQSLATSWPVGKADDFLVLAQQEESPDVLSVFAMNHGEAGAKWFEDLLDSGTLPAETQDKITRSRIYAEFMKKSPSVELEKRLSVLAAFNPDSSSDVLLSVITNSDIAKVLKNGRDYRFAFRNGTMTAEEVVSAISNELPQLAARSPENIRTVLFGELAEEDGPRAMSLLGNLPDGQRWDAAMQPVVSMFHGVNPQQFYDYIQHIPVDASAQSMDERINAWKKLGKENHNRLGESYVNWVRQLPEGSDKDMAALSIVESANMKNQKLADEFAATIKDDRIRQRIPLKP